MANNFFSLSSIRQLLKKDNKTSFSSEAVETARIEAEKLVIRIGEKATEIARHSDRKIVQSKDIEFAIKNL